MAITAAFTRAMHLRIRQRNTQHNIRLKMGEGSGELVGRGPNGAHNRTWSETVSYPQEWLG